jgi:hypothetical protein
MYRYAHPDWTICDASRAAGIQSLTAILRMPDQVFTAGVDDEAYEPRDF